VSRDRCVDDQKAAGFPVTAACQAAEVSTSGYYDWHAGEIWVVLRSVDEIVEHAVPTVDAHQQGTGGLDRGSRPREARLEGVWAKQGGGRLIQVDPL
jgi:hypothetical protein